MAAAPAVRDALHSTGLRILLVVLLFFAALVLLAACFPWDWLRGPLNRYVSEHTGRHFAITRKLDVKLGRTTRILADGIEFANPGWARDRDLVRAESAEIDIELLPLLQRRIALPRIALHRPQLGLQMEADGRRSWALGRDSADPGTLPEIGELVVDEGSLHFVAPHWGADVKAQFALAGAGRASVAATPLPLSFTAQGTWKKEVFSAQGRAGNVLSLARTQRKPFPAELRATAGRTTLAAHGEVASLATMDGADAQVILQGRNLADLYHLLGVVMPETPQYTARFHLAKDGEVWNASGIAAKLGNSDLEGHLAYDSAGRVGRLTGEVRSRVLDFNDLAPLVGLREQPREAASTHVAGSGPVAKAPRQARGARNPGRKVLPTAPLDLERLHAMNADVRYTALAITHPRELPFERAKLHVQLQDAVLKLDPLDMGLAGGTVGGRMTIDARTSPATTDLRLAVRGLQLNRLFPTVKLAQASLGQVHGDILLRGRGNSIAQMLASSSGDVGVAMGSGQVSNLLLEVAGLDGGEIIKFLLKGDRNVRMRCAGAAFDVNHGQATARVLVLDTVDTVIYGEGGFNFGNETLALVLRPYPKDKSILALRSPLKLDGTFAAVRPSVEAGPLLGRAGVALALGAINPLLALAATIETGPGKDANCSAVLREATGPDAGARVADSAMPPASASVLGGPPQENKRGRWSRWMDARGHPGAQYPLEPARPPTPAQ
jgi:uncharacterized protein involved in outer membrane biogenesis